MAKRIYKLAVLLILLLPVAGSCGRRMIPYESGEKAIKAIDEDAFNYYYVEGIKLKLGGQAGEALRCFEECIRLNPQSDGSYYQIAQILMAGGDNANAKKFLKRAVSIDGNNEWYLLMLSGLYYQESNLDSAILYYEMIVKSDGSSDGHLLTLGNLYAESKRYEDAGKVYERFDNKYGVNENSTMAEVRNLLAMKKFDDAERKTKELLNSDLNNLSFNSLLADVYRAKGENEKALSVYKDLIERNPENGEIQFALCDFLFSQKSYEELFELLPTVLINTNISREQKIAFMAGLLEDKEIVRDYSQNMSLSLMILEASYKGDEIVPLLRPDLLSREGKDKDAVARLEELVKENQGNYYAWEKMLLIYLQMEDYKTLFGRAQECATLFNRSFLAKLLYATSAAEMGKFQIAEEELRKAEILAGSDNEMILQVVTMRADVYYRMKDFDKAFGEFDKAIAMNNQDLTILNNYAYYLAEQNLRLKEAEAMIEKVIATEGDNNTFLDTYAWVLYKRGKEKEAEKVMEKIIGSGEKPDAEWFEHYGYILKKLKKCDEAVLNWNVALKLDSTKQKLLTEIENCTR